MNEIDIAIQDILNGEDVDSSVVELLEASFKKKLAIGAGLAAGGIAGGLLLKRYLNRKRREKGQAPVSLRSIIGRTTNNVLSERSGKTIAGASASVTKQQIRSALRAVLRNMGMVGKIFSTGLDIIVDSVHKSVLDEITNSDREDRELDLEKIVDKATLAAESRWPRGGTKKHLDSMSDMELEKMYREGISLGLSPRLLLSFYEDRIEGMKDIDEYVLLRVFKKRLNKDYMREVKIKH